MVCWEGLGGTRRQCAGRGQVARDHRGSILEGRHTGKGQALKTAGVGSVSLRHGRGRVLEARHEASRGEGSRWSQEGACKAGSRWCGLDSAGWERVRDDREE